MAGLAITTVGYLRGRLASSSLQGGGTDGGPRRQTEASEPRKSVGGGVLKILQVTPGYYPVIGGVERHVQALAERLAARGHEVTVATMQPRERRLDDESIRGVTIRRFGAVGLGDAYRLPLHFDRFLANLGTNGMLSTFTIITQRSSRLRPLPGVCPLVVTTHLNDTPHSAVAGLLHVPYSIVGRWAVGRATGGDLRDSRPSASG